MPSIPQQRRMELSSIRRCFITYRESDANTDFPTLYSSLHFNQRTRMGCDRRIGDLKPRIFKFQSTHPHGVRLLLLQVFLLVLCFNPRTRTGCDRILSNELNIIVQIYRICE